MLLPKSTFNKYMKITAKCPLGCGSTYQSGTKTTRNTKSPGHQESVRYCFLLKMFQVLDASGKDTALTLAKQEDSRGKRYEVSHRCHAHRDDLCIDVQHFELEPKSTNDRRGRHQSGNDVCNCAEHGDPPCMLNGTIGEKVCDNDGVHIGWKRAKRIKK